MMQVSTVDAEGEKKPLSSMSSVRTFISQMCLIFALWEVTNPPFPALDEWDVFLDAVNHNLVYQQMIRMMIKPFNPPVTL